MKHCDRIRCIKSVFPKHEKAPQKKTKWGALCNTIQCIITMHFIKCGSWVFHRLHHHNGLCKLPCCFKFCRRNLWKNDLILHLLDAKVGLLEIGRREWREKEGLRVKEKEGGRGWNISYWGVVVIAMGYLPSSYGGGFGTTCWPNGTEHIITTSSSSSTNQSQKKCSHN